MKHLDDDWQSFWVHACLALLIPLKMRWKLGVIWRLKWLCRPLHTCTYLTADRYTFIAQGRCDHQRRIGWTGAMFCAGLKSLITDLKLDKCLYDTHSLWIGAATSTSLAKLPDAYIQILGRWRSNAFKRYIRSPPNEVTNMSKIIAAGPH